MTTTFARHAASAAIVTAVALISCGGGQSFDGSYDDDSGAAVPVARSQERLLQGAQQTWQRSEVGWYGTLTPNPNTPGGFDKFEICTATLIHQQFIILASHCFTYPEPQPNAYFFFYNSTGQVYPFLAIDKIWALPPAPDFPQRGGTKANLSSDILLARLASPVTSITPATIANVWGGPDGATVSVYGFGKWGAPASDPACTTGTAPDFQKRAMNFSWGSNWPVCSGDSGGPTFNAAIPGGDLVTVTGSIYGSGSVVRYREEILEQIRVMLGAGDGVPGVKRAGVVLNTVTGTNATNCEFFCQAGTACHAWSFSTTGNTCTLLGSAGLWTPDSTSTSGLATRAFANASAVATGTPTTTTALSANECASKCRRSSTYCAQYNFNTSTNACLLYGGIGGVGQQSGMTTGNILQGTETSADRPGGDIRSFTVGFGDLSCAEQCERDEECRAYAYTPSNGKCWLKWGIPAAKASSTVQSGVKLPPALPNVRLDGTEIHKSGAFQLDPSGAFYVPSPPRAEQCRADCASDSTCVGYSISKPAFGKPVLCRMLSFVTSEAPDGGMDSNYKGLTYF